VIVLLCDDHALLAEALGDVLTARGDVVVLTSDPAEAVEAARLHEPDVCVMDRTFPGGDLGVGAVRDVLAASPQTRVLMLTGRPDPATARAAVGAGARGFLKKDEPLDSIVDAVDQVAAGLLVVDVNVLRPDVRSARASLLPGLTTREREVLERMVNGQSASTMAADLEVSYSTVRTHVQNILVKLGVHSQLEASAYAVEHGLVESEAG
jgi:two-component system nitrate/nitrite response regulator NarL